MKSPIEGHKPYDFSSPIYAATEYGKLGYLGTIHSIEGTIRSYKCTV